MLHQVIGARWAPVDSTTGPSDTVGVAAPVVGTDRLHVSRRRSCNGMNKRLRIKTQRGLRDWSREVSLSSQR